MLKPICIETKSGAYIFDVEAFVFELRKVMEAAMRKFQSQPPTCIRCGEQPTVLPKVLKVDLPGSTGISTDKRQHEQNYDSHLQFRLKGWRMLDGGKDEALCPECLEFVKTVGKDGGA